LCTEVRDGLLEAALKPKATTLADGAGAARVGHERGLGPRTRHGATWAKRGARGGTGATLAGSERAWQAIPLTA
jgi:hypothetical protein